MTGTFPSKGKNKQAKKKKDTKFFVDFFSRTFLIEIITWKRKINSNENRCNVEIIRF